MIGAVVPTYNREANLELLLASLERQSSAGFQVVVADDGSTDGTGALIARLAQRPVWRGRLARISCGPHQGVRTGRARNIGAANLDAGATLLKRTARAASIQSAISTPSATPDSSRTLP